MDPRAQDVVRCDICDTNPAQMHCDTCFVNLCKACVGEHVFNESKDHKIVKFKSKKTTPIYPSCLKHTKEKCEMYCKHCDVSICTACVASGAHRGHKISQLLEKCEIIKKEIQRDNGELRSKLTPLYQKMLNDLEMRIKEVEDNCEEASKLIDKQRDLWQKEIDNIVNELKTTLETKKEKEVKTLKVNKSEIKQTLSKINYALQSNTETLESNDLGAVIEYKGQNAVFSKSIEIVDVSLPIFTPREINEESIRKQFGALSSDISEDQSLAPTHQLLMDEPKELLSIYPGIVCNKNIAYLKDNYIWVTNNRDSVSLFDFNRRVNLISFEESPCKAIYDITVLNNKELVFSCSQSKTVYIVQNNKAETLITLNDWVPRGICATNSGDLLITMTQGLQSKVARYSGIVEKQVVQFDDCDTASRSSGWYYLYVTENRNSDICVSREDVVEVFMETGQRKFQYIGHFPRPKWHHVFSPRGITTDSYCHILIADTENHCIHIIDQDGSFLRYIECGMRRPWGLCIDSENVLFVADTDHRRNKRKKSSQIVKIRFLKL